MTEFDLRALLEALHNEDVRFVVIGGIAVAAHGFVRGTEDLDLVPEPDADNLRRLATALAKLDATVHTRFGALDVVQRAQGVPSYLQLVEDAVDSELLGIPVKVCSLGRLREMKQAQSRSQDLLDLENLPESD